jgi:hypothetical protein
MSGAAEKTSIVSGAHGQLFKRANRHPLWGRVCRKRTAATRFEVPVPGLVRLRTRRRASPTSLTRQSSARLIATPRESHCAHDKPRSLPGGVVFFGDVAACEFIFFCMALVECINLLSATATLLLRLT